MKYHLSLCWFLFTLIVLTLFIESRFGFRIQRVSPNGDIFEKNTPLIVAGTSVSVPPGCDVEGKGSAYWYNSTHCQCLHGQTFVIDPNERPPEPKCLENYGGDKDDLDCDFHFNDASNVKGLDGQSLTQTVGTLLYKNKHVSSCSITGSNLWNAGWQNLPDLFQIQNDNNLMWKSTSPRLVAQQYLGILFKISLICYEGRKRKDDCVLFKILGTRSYPLQNNPRRSTIVIFISSSTSFNVHVTTPHHESTRRSTSSVKLTLIASPASTATMETPKIKTTNIQASRFRPLSTATTTVEQSSSTIVTTSQPSRTLSPINAATTTILKPSTDERTNIKFFSTSMTSIIQILPTSSKIETSKMTSKWKSTKSFVPESKTESQQPTISTTMMPTTSVVPSKSYVSTTSVVPTKGKDKPNKTSKSSKSSKYVPLPTSISKENGGRTVEQKQSQSGSGLIAGVVAAALVTVFAVIAVFYLHHKRKILKSGSKKRKETLTLNLTTNTFMNENENGRNESTRRNIGNPVYADKIRLSLQNGKSSNEEIYEYACTDGVKNPPNNEPIYREVDEEGPIYAETDAVYEPIKEQEVGKFDNYQPLDASTLPRRKTPAYEGPNNTDYLAPTPAPVYQVLENDNEMDGKRAQSPIYQVVESEATYQELDSNKQGEEGDNLYTGIVSQQDPLYHELDPFRCGVVNHDFDDEEV